MNLSFYYRVKSAVKRRLLRPLIWRALTLIPQSFQDTMGLNVESPKHSPRALEKKLWAGHSAQALEDLHWIVTSQRMLRGTRADAAWALARWHAAKAEYELSLQYILLMQALAKSHQFEKGPVAVQIDNLNRLGRGKEAQRILDLVLYRHGELCDYRLAYSNVLCVQGKDDQVRLAWINKIYRQYGFVELGLRDPLQPMAIDNLQAREPLELAYREGPKVTVLMPAYNSSTTIVKSIRGLLAQTWKNLEIIPVDDCSTDDTWEVLKSFSQQDKRVLPIRHATNTGAYGARLTGLAQASGDFITVHDADDWSHPQKIETQVEALLSDESIVACMSSWCRVSRNLYVNRVGAIPGPNLQRQNESSLMFRSTLVNKLGAWDRVRAAADTEFIWRIQAAFGKKAIKVVHEDVPLSFSLSQEDSLTQTGPTHVKTIFYGTRRTYRESQKWWHRHAATGELKIPLTDCDRRFAAPSHLLMKHPKPIDFDFLFIGDFALSQGVGGFQEKLINALVSTGKYRIGLFHWPRYEKEAQRPVRSQYYEMASKGSINIIAAEDTLTARQVIVTDIIATSCMLDRFPAWKVEEVYACAGHRNVSKFPNGQVDTGLVERNLASAMGIQVVWLPVSLEDAERMQQDDSLNKVSSTIIAHEEEVNEEDLYEMQKALETLDG